MDDKDIIEALGLDPVRDSDIIQSLGLRLQQQAAEGIQAGVEGEPFDPRRVPERPGMKVPPIPMKGPDELGGFSQLAHTIYGGPNLKEGMTPEEAATAGRDTATQRMFRGMQHATAPIANAFREAVNTQARIFTGREVKPPTAEDLLSINYRPHVGVLEPGDRQPAVGHVADIASEIVPFIAGGALARGVGTAAKEAWVGRNAPEFADFTHFLRTKAPQLFEKWVKEAEITGQGIDDVMEAFANSREGIPVWRRLRNAYMEWTRSGRSPMFEPPAAPAAAVKPPPRPFTGQGELFPQQGELFKFTGADPIPPSPVMPKPAIGDKLFKEGTRQTKKGPIKVRQYMGRGKPLPESPLVDSEAQLQLPLSKGQGSLPLETPPPTGGRPPTPPPAGGAPAVTGARDPLTAPRVGMGEPDLTEAQMFGKGVRGWLHRVGEWLTPEEQLVIKHGGEELMKPLMEAERKHSQFVASNWGQFLKTIWRPGKLGAPAHGEHAFPITRGQHLRNMVAEQLTGAPTSEQTRGLADVRRIAERWKQLRASIMSQLEKENLPEEVMKEIEKLNIDDALANPEAFQTVLRKMARYAYDMPAAAQVEAAMVPIEQSGKNPRLVSAVNRYLHSYTGARQPDFRDKHVLDVVRRFQYNRFLGLNPTSPAWNLSQTWLNTVPVAGYRATGSAIKRVGRHPIEYFKQARNAGVLEALPESEEGFFEALKYGSQSKLAKLGKAYESTILRPFNLTEQSNRVVAWLAGKESALDALRKGTLKSAEFTSLMRKHGNFEQVRELVMSGKASIKEVDQAAWDMVRQTQFMFGAKSSIPATQGPVKGLIMQFGNYPLKQFNFVKNIMTKGTPAQKRRLLTSYVTTAGVVGGTEGGRRQFWDLLMDFLPAGGPSMRDWQNVVQFFENMPEKDLEDIIGQAVIGIVGELPGIRGVRKLAKEEEW